MFAFVTWIAESSTDTYGCLFSRPRRKRGRKLQRKVIENIRKTENHLPRKSMRNQLARCVDALRCHNRKRGKTIQKLIENIPCDRTAVRACAHARSYLNNDARLLSYLLLLYNMTLLYNTNSARFYVINAVESDTIT